MFLNPYQNRLHHNHANYLLSKIDHDFYRNSVNISNKINIDIISDNIKEQIDPLKDKKIIEKEDVNTIITNVKSCYNLLINHKKYFKEYDLVKVEYKQAIFNMCLDKLLYIEKKEILIKIINDKLNKIKKPVNDKLSLTDDEINYFIYDYFKNNLFQYSDDSVPKPVLFNYDKDPEGFILMNDSKLIYFDKNGNDIPDKDLSESITKLKTLFKSRRNNIYIEPYIYKKGEKYIKTYNIFKGENSIAVGKNSSDLTDILERFNKLILSRFKKLKDNLKLFEPKMVAGFKHQDKYDIFHLIFRIKDLFNDDNKIYVVSNELSYLNK